MTLKTCSKSEAILQCITGGSPTTLNGDYGITKMAVLLNYIQLSQSDMERMLKSRIQLPMLKYLQFSQPTNVSNQVNLNFSVSVQDKIRNLYVGFFGNMTSTYVLADSTNTAANIIPSSTLANVNTAQC